jgi:glycosyltransferase involved in cell wall biosynthesis
VLLLEAHHGGSHRQWAEGVAAHSRHDVRLLTHAGGFWKWRMHGAAVTLAREADALARDGWTPDVVLASDMVNVAAFLGLARRSCGSAAVALYMHENQLTYPLPDGAARDDSYAMTNWVSMCAADVVVFNSEFHRREWFDALPGFLRRFPDHRHSALIEGVEQRSSVLPVGVDPVVFGARRDVADGPPLILWNHRWEYDKNPDAFVAAVDALAADGLPFRLAIAGQRFTNVPPALDGARVRHAGRLVHFGTASPDDYLGLLRRADVVVSTALHDFFGLAVVEAMAAGALPVLPRRLAYPELVPPEIAARWLYDDDRQLVDRLHRAVVDDAARLHDAAAVRAHVHRFRWPHVAREYDALIDRL